MDNVNDSKNEMKKCSYCGEDIKADSRRCPYCGSLLEVRVDELKLEPEEMQTEYPELDTEAENIEIKDTVKLEDAASDQPKAFDAKSPRINPVNPLSNGMKVFITALCTAVPGLGQLAGIIISIVFMNTEEDPDRKSFGVALLIASLIVFVFSCLSCLVLVMAAGALKS